MRQPPISQSEIDARITGHLDELLSLWCSEQGACKPRDLELIASVLPFPRDETIRVLDLCCGAGDVGRAIRREYPKAQIDGVDRDPFLTAICIGVNCRDRIPGNTVLRDLQDDSWDAGLPGHYGVVATVNALRWFDAERAGALLVDVHRLLRSGGIFLFAEPVSAEAPLASGFAAWKSKQPQRYSQEAWERFWSRANAILGYDHVALLGSRDSNRIGDGLCVAGWIALAAKAGFRPTDVLLKDADQVIIAAVKP
jgi:trans-aconitate 2-methyltransferase